MTDDLNDLPPRLEFTVAAPTPDRVERAVRQMRHRRRVRRASTAGGLVALLGAGVAVPALTLRDTSSDQISTAKPTPGPSSSQASAPVSPRPVTAAFATAVQRAGVVVTVTGDFCGPHETVGLGTAFGRGEGTAGRVRSDSRGRFSAQVPVAAAAVDAGAGVIPACYAADGRFTQLNLALTRALLARQQVLVAFNGNRFGATQPCPPGALVTLQQSDTGPASATQSKVQVGGGATYILPQMTVHLDRRQRATVTATCVDGHHPAPTLTMTVQLQLPDQAIRVYGDCTHPTLQPPQIVLTCADHGIRLDHLRWTSWTATRATATGTLVYNDCRPSCAAGHFHQVPGTAVTLTGPVRGTDGQLLWSLLQTEPQPPGYATGPFHGGPFPLPTRPD